MIMKKDIKKAEWDDFVRSIPYSEIEKILESEYGKREVKHFNDYMSGQTVALIDEKVPAVYITDLMRFLRYRKQNLPGSLMPLDD